MELKFWSRELQLARRWAIANRRGADVHSVVFVQLTDDDGVTGLGEGAPSSIYDETAAGALAFIRSVDPNRLSFADVPTSMQAIQEVAPHHTAARCALNIALLDGAAKRAKKPLHEFLGLGFRENHHVTSFSIGLDRPEVIRQKTLDASRYPLLKLKVGDANDRENFAALREVAPDKAVRVDANESWTSREQALERIEWIARDGHIEFVEQPMPRGTNPEDLAWLKARSPLPLLADESYQTAADVARCLEGFHGVNVKLVKTGGASGAVEALQAARRAGLKTMIGCMIESSVLISAAAHLAELADCLDIDGNLLITNDPYAGVTAENGIVSFANASLKTGLQVSPRQS